MKKLGAILLCFIISITSLYGSNTDGIHGPQYLISAWNLGKRNIVFHGHSRIYFNTKNVILPESVWSAQGSINLYYGLNNNLELGISQIISQDDVDGRNTIYKIPNDLYLRFKFASFGSVKSPLNFGLQITSKIPSGKYHDTPFEPYSAGNIEFSIMTLASFSTDISQPENTMNYHINLGIVNHDDSKISQAGRVSNSQELIYGLGVVYPKDRFQFSLEYYGNFMTRKPAEGMYYRDNYAYLSSSILYSLKYNFALLLGVDIRSSKYKEKDETIYTASRQDLPLWRINFGVKLNILSLIRKEFQDTDNYRLRDKNGNNGGASFDDTEKSNKIYGKIVEEKKQVETAEQELLRIRDERRRMDEMLSRLRKILEISEEEKRKNDDE